MGQHRLIQWLRLIRTPGIGPVRIARLLESFEDAAAILKAPLAQLRGIPGIGPAIAAKLAAAPPTQAVEAEWSQLNKLGIQILPLTDDHYPALLREIHNPPPVLFVQGDATLLNPPLPMAIVGSRHPTHRGRTLAQRLAHDLVKQGVVIVSGMAEGIDGAAHQGALEGGGLTIGVVATGLDVNYPPSHHLLRQRICQQGCLISESPLGTPPAPHLFPARNRIISGLSRGVLVVEATLASGSLITARLALEQGREVFAVPGPANSPMSQGTHALLKQGAGLVEQAKDLLEAMAWNCTISGSSPSSTAISSFTSLANQQTSDKISNILQLLRDGPRQCDELVRVCGLTVSELSSILLQLELAGILERLPGDYVVLRIF